MTTVQQALVYFAEQYNEQWVAVVEKHSPRELNNYPVAVAFINIVAMFADFLALRGSAELQQTSRRAALYGELVATIRAAEDLYELVTGAFLFLDAVWDEMNGTYVRFNEIISQLRSHIETVAPYDGEHSVSHFKERLLNSQLAYEPAQSRDNNKCNVF